VIELTQLARHLRTVSLVTFLRLISPALRSGLMTVAGTALIAAPFALGLEAAAIVVGVFVGVLMVAVGVAGSESQGRGTLPVSAQAVYDRGLALGLLLTAVIFGIAGQEDALPLFALAGLAALLVSSITRYSARPPWHKTSSHR
jgi:hypothetical protein